MSPVAATRDSAKRFYPQTVAIAQTGGDEFSLTAAWVMGQDTTVPEFHQELLQLLNDSNPMVGRNAALALVRFGDAIRIALRFAPCSSLTPCPSPQAGTLIEAHEAAGSDKSRHASRSHPNRRREDRSPLASSRRGSASWEVPDGAPVAARQPIMEIDPSSAEVWEALRALYLIGQKRGSSCSAASLLAQTAGDEASVHQQADATAKAIKVPPKAMTLGTNHPGPPIMGLYEATYD